MNPSQFADELKFFGISVDDAITVSGFRRLLNSIGKIDYKNLNRKEYSEYLNSYIDWLRNSWVYTKSFVVNDRKRSLDSNIALLLNSKQDIPDVEPVVEPQQVRQEDIRIEEPSDDDILKILEKRTRKRLEDKYRALGRNPDSPKIREAIEKRVASDMEKHRAIYQQEELELPEEEEPQQVGNYISRSEIIPLCRDLENVNVQLNNPNQPPSLFYLKSVCLYNVYELNASDEEINRLMISDKQEERESHIHNIVPAQNKVGWNTFNYQISESFEAKFNDLGQFLEKESEHYYSYIRTALIRRVEQLIGARLSERSINEAHKNDLLMGLRRGINSVIEKTNLEDVIEYCKDISVKYNFGINDRTKEYGSGDLQGYIIHYGTFEITASQYFDMYRPGDQQFKYPYPQYKFARGRGLRSNNTNAGFCFFEPTLECECCGNKWCEVKAPTHDDKSIFCLERAILYSYNITANEKIEIDDSKLYAMRVERGIGFDSQLASEDFATSFAPVSNPMYVKNILEMICREYKINIDLKFYTLNCEYFMNGEVSDHAPKWRSRKGDDISVIGDEDSETVKVSIGCFAGHIWPLNIRGAQAYFEKVNCGKYGPPVIKEGYAETIANIQKEIVEIEKKYKKRSPKEILNSKTELWKYQTEFGTLSGDVSYLLKLQGKYFDDELSASEKDSFTRLTGLKEIPKSQLTRDEARSLIVSKKRSKNKVGFVVYYDIETYSNEYKIQEIYSFSYMVCDSNNNTVEGVECVYGDKYHCINSFIALVKKYQKATDNKVIFVAHNGAKFDTSILKQYLVNAFRMGEGFETNQTMLNGSLIRLKLYNVIFVDSMRFLPGSLDSNAEQFKLNVRKLKYPYEAFNSEAFRNSEFSAKIPESIKDEYLALREKYYLNYDKEFNDIFVYFRTLEINGAEFNPRLFCTLYNNYDVKILAEVMNKFRNAIGEALKVDDSGLDPLEFCTISSLAYSYFDYNGAFDGVRNVSGPLREWISMGAAGGRVHVNKENRYMKIDELLELDGKPVTEESQTLIRSLLDKTIVDVDGVSLYPSAISSSNVPTGKIIMMSEKQCRRVEDKCRMFQNTIHADPFKRDNTLLMDSIFEGKYFMVCCDIETLNAWQIPQVSSMNCQAGKDDNKRIWTNDKVEGIVLHSINLESIIRGQGIKSMKIHNGIIFEGRSTKMSEMIETLFNLRLKYKAEKNEAGQLAVKLLMNSAYGKTLLKPQKSESKIKVFKGKTCEEVRNKLWDYERRNKFRIIGDPVVFNFKNDAKELRVEFQLRNFGKVHQNQCQIGATILAQSKYIMDSLLGYFEHIGAKVSYTDTDSLHVDMGSYLKLKGMNAKGIKGLPIFGKQMTQLQDDFDSEVVNGKTDKPLKDFPSFSISSIFGDKKCYIDRLLAVDRSTSTYKIINHMRFKGVNAHQLTPKDYEDLYFGGSLTVPCLGFDENGQIKKQFKKLNTGNIMIIPCNNRTIKFGDLYVDPKNNIQDEADRIYTQEIIKQATEFNEESSKMTGKEFLNLRYTSSH